MFNRTQYGLTFNQSTIDNVWRKGQTVSGYDPDKVRRDRCGALMQRSQYGNTDHAWGWEIDHIVPKAKDGSDDLSNLQPLQWANNRHKGDNWPYWTCKVA